MNNKIAHILKGYLQDLTWVDKISGLVQTVNIRTGVGESIVNKSYPVSCDITYEECIKGRYQDLTPNSKKKSVLYFEDGGVSMVERRGNTIVFQSSLRLVCWLNLKEIHGATCEADLEHCQVSGHYVVEVVKALPVIPFTSHDLINVMITNISEVVRSVAIFSKYTYNEQSTQYLLFPYDFFALDLQVKFTIPCIST